MATQGGRGGCVGHQQPVPCGAHGLVLAPDLNTGLGDGDSGGPGLPVMPQDKPLPRLTPPNITHQKDEVLTARKPTERVDLKMP